jgi:hypothetical protein
MLDARGAYSGGFAVTTDITAQKEAEDALRRALDRERELGQLKTQFVSTTSHEFRTPLATILTTTEMLMYYRDRYDAAQIDTRLEKIRTQVNHLKQIMDEVLQLARVQARRMEFKPALNDLCSLCEEIAEEFNSSSQYRERVHYQTLQPDVKMVYDPRMMRQIITNLISNALKYSPNGKAVDFTLEPDGEDICLIIQDYGMGIPAESVSHLFEPFYRAPNVENISGTGLGLPIVKESVEIHGGTISFTTEVNRGTRFMVRFPYKNMISPEEDEA